MPLSNFPLACPLSDLEVESDIRLSIVSLQLQMNLDLTTTSWHFTLEGIFARNTGLGDHATKHETLEVGERVSLNVNLFHHQL